MVPCCLRGAFIFLTQCDFPGRTPVLYNSNFSSIFRSVPALGVPFTNLSIHLPLRIIWEATVLVALGLCSIA